MCVNDGKVSLVAGKRQVLTKTAKVYYAAAATTTILRRKQQNFDSGWCQGLCEKNEPPNRVRRSVGGNCRTKDPPDL